MYIVNIINLGALVGAFFYVVIKICRHKKITTEAFNGYV